MIPKPDESLDELRAVRITISEKFNHNVRRLASYYQKMEKDLVRDNSVIENGGSVQSRLAEEKERSPLVEA
jgi:hypothetical protein